MNRDYYFDNVKGALITLVVIGHFLLNMAMTRFVGTLLYTIYLFHMPMFVLVSGYFSKNVYRYGKFRADKLMRLIWFYFLFELAVHVTENLAAWEPITWRVDFFFEDGAPWYLMAMIWWQMSVPLITELDARAVMAGAICLGLFSGYQESVGDVLALSRTLAFAPFFYAGYYLKREQVQRFLDSKWKWFFTIVSLCIASVVALGMGSFLEPYVNIVYGVNYRRLTLQVYQWGAVIRTINYICAVIMGLGMMALIPRRKVWWTFLGQRTLQIYILHRLLRDMLQYWGFFGRYTSWYKRTVIMVVLLAAAATVVLANPWIAWLFRQLQKVPDKLYEKWKHTP